MRGCVLFLSDQSVSCAATALLADEGICEQVAKAAVDYAADVLKVGPEGTPTPWQLNYICVIEDAIIHHIDWALETKTTVGELEQTLKQFIDNLGQIYSSTQKSPVARTKSAVH